MKEFGVLDKEAETASFCSLNAVNKKTTTKGGERERAHVMGNWKKNKWF